MHCSNIERTNKQTSVNVSKTRISRSDRAANQLSLHRLTPPHFFVFSQRGVRSRYYLLRSFVLYSYNVHSSAETKRGTRLRVGGGPFSGEETQDDRAPTTGKDESYERVNHPLMSGTRGLTYQRNYIRF